MKKTVLVAATAGALFLAGCAGSGSGSTTAPPQPTTHHTPRNTLQVVGWNTTVVLDNGLKVTVGAPQRTGHVYTDAEYDILNENQTEYTLAISMKNRSNEVINRPSPMNYKTPKGKGNSWAKGDGTVNKLLPGESYEYTEYFSVPQGSTTVRFTWQGVVFKGPLNTSSSTTSSSATEPAGNDVTEPDSSGATQFRYGCEQGYIPESECDAVLGNGWDR